MTKTTLESLNKSINRLETTVDNLSNRMTEESQSIKEFIVEHVSNEINDLAFVCDSNFRRIDEKIDSMQIEMKAGFDRIDKTKVSYDSPIKVKKSLKVA